MKKLIAVLIFGILALAGYSQNQSLDKSMSNDQTNLWYTGNTIDVTSATDSVWTYTVKKKTDSKVYCYVDLVLDSISGTADTVWVYLQNKMFDELDFVSIDSSLWTGSTEQGTIAFSPGTPVMTFSPMGVDTIAGTIVYDTIYAMTDTAGLAGYPADSIVINGIDAVISGTIIPTVYSTLLTQSNQDNAGEYWRVNVVSTDASFIVGINRLNFKFLKP